jgi:hypothetical protein
MHLVLLKCLFHTCRKGDVWMSSRSKAAKQVIPRRVANFVGPLCVIAEDLLAHLETLQDEAGDVEDVGAELYKWAFQGMHACRQCWNSIVAWLHALLVISFVLRGEVKEQRNRELE